MTCAQSVSNASARGPRFPVARLQTPAPDRQQTLPKVMRGFGRQCRGHGKVFVTLAPQTEKQVLELGGSSATWAQEAQDLLRQAPQLEEARRGRLRRDLAAARDAPRHLTKHSQRLTQGKPLPQYKIVQASAPTIAPIIKGKSNCPAQFGRKTGRLSAPAAGVIFAHRVPADTPSDPSSVLPLRDKGQQALDLVAAPKRLQVHSLGGDLGGNDTALRHARYQRGMLTVGIPTTVEPINPPPRPEEVLEIRNGSGLNRMRPPIKCTWPAPVATVVRSWQVTLRP